MKKENSLLELPRREQRSILDRNVGIKADAQADDLNFIRAQSQWIGNYWVA